MNDNTLFPATLMPDKDWWQALWPEPDAVLRAVGVEPGMHVVDLCCGDGLFTQALCQQVQAGTIWALDLDNALLRQTEQRCHDVPNFHSIAGDARDLPHRIDTPVDLVFMANTFHGVPDKTALSQTVHQSLRPGGRFALVNWYRRPREDTQVLGQPRGPDTQMRMDPADVQAVVEPAGFKLEKIVDVGPYHYGIVFLKNTDVLARSDETS